MTATTADVERRLQDLVGDIDPATKKGRKRLAILDAATQSFADRGYRATSMDELAATVGVAKGTLYLYFPTKFDLIVGCIAREKLRWLPQMRELFEGKAPAPQRLKAWIVAILTLPTQSPLMSRLIDGSEDMSELMADYPPELMSESETMAAELVHPILAEVAGPGHRWNELELGDRFTVIRSLAHLGPLLSHEWVRPGVSAQRFASILADLIVDGLRGRELAQPFAQGGEA